MSTIDWASLKKTAEDSSRPLPTDWYDVTVEKAEATVASTGSDMIKLVLRVNGGPHDGRRLWTNFVLTPDNGFALSIFFRNLAAFGVDPAQVSPSGSLEPIANALVNRVARAQVGVRTWQGQERNEIQNVVSSGNAQVAAPGAGPALGGPPVPGTIGPATTVNVPGPVASTAPSTPTPTPQVPQGPSVPQGPGPQAPPDLPF